MILHVSNLVVTIDTSVVSDPAPETAEEKIAFVNDTLSEVNSFLAGRRLGVRIEGYVEGADISTRWR